MTMSSLAQRLTTAPGKVAGRISIELTDEEMEECRELAAKRNQSYDSGATKDTNFASDGGQEIHARGLVAEYALSLAYANAQVDGSISAAGDGGVDATIEYEGDLVTVDVKSSEYQGNPWIQVKTDSPTAGEADVYISAYVDGNRVELAGLVQADELLSDENIEQSSAQGFDHMNYTIKEEEDGFDSLPEPTADDLERVEYEVA
jgi:hypothetical protein